MNIHSIIPNPIAATTGATTSNSTTTQNTNDEFIQLLSAQLENQSPLDPVDPDQFTTELVQFNMLDQLTQINNTLQNALSPVATTATATNPTSASYSNAQGANHA
ncbi:MAG: flagellar hook capping FlgD N-terminal domain-containing protein [Terriglobales bacterium]|jgi:flagellar basal-body rod modification protein FlgD